MSTLTNAPTLAAAALSDPSSIYLQPSASVLSSTVQPSAIPLTSLRSVFRRAYFTYQFYYPEMRFGMCLMRFASRADDDAVFEQPTASAVTDGTDSGGLDAMDGVTTAPIIDATDFAAAARSSDDNEVDAPNMYRDLGVALQTVFRNFVCRPIDGDSTGDDDDANRRCAQQQTDLMAGVVPDVVRPPSGTGLDDASWRVYRTVLLNLAEQWLRSSRVLRPIVRSMSGNSLRRMRRFADVVVDGVVRRLREMLVPGLYGCTQQYLVEMMWRSVETWI